MSKAKDGRGAKPDGVNKPLKRKREQEDLDELDKRVAELDVQNADIETFAALPLSGLTASGLEASHFKALTDVQKRAIPHGLQGADILGAAKTGSGKTLAFLVPVLENLYRKRWTEYDGLGALILSPTRELAIQIFEVLRKIGRYHTFSAGLVIGGKSLQEERDRLGRMDILVCTPGRMLQHMDQTAAFDVGNLQMLVLDEADRILDMGFQSTVDAIVEHLPKQRQTLLFSATQTKKVSDLARLSLSSPVYVSAHEEADSATPTSLQQNYVVTPLPEKLNILWSFIRSNLKAKILVFFSSGKQVRFAYEAFRHMQPGISLLHLHGRQKQTARLDVTRNFHQAKHSCLFATDVVARGLDFPAVDWVIQLDCPEDADTYIHRVGRTARYDSVGHAVIFLAPSEESGMLMRLKERKVNLEKINIRQKKQQSIQKQLQSMCFKDPELKYLGQKAFVSYVRSIHVQKDKETFKLSELPLEEYSASLGLPGAPRIKFGQENLAKKQKNAPRGGDLLSADESSNSQASDRATKTAKTGPRTRYDRMFERMNQDVLAPHYKKLIVDQNGPEIDSSEDGEGGGASFLGVKRRLSNGSSSEEPIDEDTIGRKIDIGTGTLAIDSKRREKLLKSKKKVAQLQKKGKKLVFDDDGNPHEIYELEDEDKFRSRGAASDQKAAFLETEQERLNDVDVTDKQLEKLKRKQKKEKVKARMAEENGDRGAGPAAMLVPYDETEDVPHDIHDSETGTIESEDEPVEKELVVKKEKKWFERDVDPNRGTASHGHKPHDDGHIPRNLEDLEAIASGILG